MKKPAYNKNMRLLRALRIRSRLDSHRTWLHVRTLAFAPTILSTPWFFFNTVSKFGMFLWSARRMRGIARVDRFEWTPSFPVWSPR